MRVLLNIIIGLAVIMQILTINAEAGVTNINNSELSDLLKKGVAIIDIRTEPEWLQTGVVPGSRLLALPFEAQMMKKPDEWLLELEKLIPRSLPVILICRTGRRTIPATRFLHGSGYLQVYNVTGGIEPWIRAGLPIESYKGGEQKWKK